MSKKQGLLQRHIHPPLHGQRSRQRVGDRGRAVELGGAWVFVLVGHRATLSHLLEGEVGGPVEVHFRFLHLKTI